MASHAATATANNGGEGSSIQILPQEVVDRIAAGEVVQRPANALKELLENALDAGATKIIVHVEKQQQASSNNGSSKSKKSKTLNFSISDNGHGIAKNDLVLAATRFATSKLTSVDDFSRLQSFGFRGEALASISMVSHLTITSRTAQSSVAYECTYVDGKPEKAKHNSSNSQNPRRCARTPGTTVKVHDLFYNVPHRQRALNPSEEYSRMLATLQPYAVQVARRGVGLIVQQHQARGKSTKTVLDLNTTNLSKVQAVTRLQQQSSNTNSPENERHSQFSSPQQQEATKQVIATIFGSHLEHHLVFFQSSSGKNMGDDDEEDINDDDATNNNSNNKMSYTCEGFLTGPSLAATNHSFSLKQSTLLVFVNDRHVECPPLKRRLEDVYATLTTWKKPPFCYLSLHVPAHEVDVNVHPTKTQVALLYLDDICTHLANQIQTKLAAEGKTFGQDGSDKTSRKMTMPPAVENPYKKKKPPSSTKQSAKSTTLSQASSRSAGKDANMNENNNHNKRKRRSIDDSENDQDAEENYEGEGEEDWQDEDIEKSNDIIAAEKDHARPPAQPSRTQNEGRRRSSSASFSRPPLPSQMIRTHNATPVGAIEPFLVKRPKLSSSQTTTSSTASTPTGSMLSTQSPSSASAQLSSQNLSPEQTIHQPPCPFASQSPGAISNMDMSQPGAFAQASQQCTCREAQMQEQLSQQSTANNKSVLLPSKQRMIRPRDVTPTDCKLDSIKVLRRRVEKRADPDLQQKLRQSYFVGVVSEHRTLVQSREELCLLHHTRLAQSLFYQLALAGFGGNQVASFGRPVQVCTVIEQALQLEEDLQDEKMLGVAKGKEHGTDVGSESANNELITLSQVDETNALLASQATACLWDNSAMLEEYFGIRLEQVYDDSPQEDGTSQRPTNKPVVVLTGLPILLDGHAPPPHGLPLFLLRLATEVNYEEERPCFDGVFRELGYYYAQLSSSAHKAFIQHTLFPALTCLLVPSQQLQVDCRTLTRLSNLYKVFERC